MPQAPLQQFYIPEEQSVYLLNHHDAQKLKDWVALCQAQLTQLGYRDIELIGKGAYGFVFAGSVPQGSDSVHYVFKFSRITLPTHLQERLEEEAFMLEQVSHSRIPKLITYQRARGQSILVMERAPGWNLEQISPERRALVTASDYAYRAAAGGYFKSAAPRSRATVSACGAW